MKFEPITYPEAPAWPFSGDFVQNRHLSGIIGAPKGWSRQHPLQAAFDSGKLAKKSDPQGKADARLKAGMIFWDIFCASQMPSGRDSTDLERVSSSGTMGDTPRIRIDAQRRLQAIRAKLSFMDWQIIESVAGECYGAADTMRKLFASDYRDVVWSRMREALDSLILATS